MQKLKLTLGILMVAALFTPLSQCSHSRKENSLPPPLKTGWQKIFPRSDEYANYDYGATRLEASLGGVLTLLTFAWPLGLAFVGRRVRGKRRAWIFYAIGACMPATYFITLIRAIVLRGASLTEFWSSLLVLAGMGAALFSLCAVRFSKKLG